MVSALGLLFWRAGYRISHSKSTSFFWDGFWDLTEGPQPRICLETKFDDRGSRIIGWSSFPRIESSVPFSWRLSCGFSVLSSSLFIPQRFSNGPENLILPSSWSISPLVGFASCARMCTAVPRVFPSYVGALSHVLFHANHVFNLVICSAIISSAWCRWNEPTASEQQCTGAFFPLLQMSTSPSKRARKLASDSTWSHMGYFLPSNCSCLVNVIRLRFSWVSNSLSWKKPPSFFLW